MLLKKYENILEKYAITMDLQNCKIKVLDFVFNSKNLFFLALFGAERITYWLINYKINIIDTLINEKPKKKISKELFNNCYNYFERFYKLSILRNELINDHCVVTEVNSPANIWPMPDTKIIPLFLRRLHGYTFDHKDELEIEILFSEEKSQIIDYFKLREFCREN